MRRRNDRSPTPLMRLKVAPKQRISLHAATYCRERTGKSGLDKLEYGQISNTKQGGWARLYVSNEQTNRIAVVSPDGVSPGLKSIRPITYNNLQHGAHNQQRCYFSYVWTCADTIFSRFFPAFLRLKERQLQIGRIILTTGELLWG